MPQLPTDLNEFRDFERNTHHKLAQTYHSSLSCPIGLLSPCSTLLT